MDLKDPVAGMGGDHTADSSHLLGEIQSIQILSVYPWYIARWLKPGKHLTANGTANLGSTSWRRHLCLAWCLTSMRVQARILSLEKHCNGMLNIARFWRQCGGRGVAFSPKNRVSLSVPRISFSRQQCDNSNLCRACHKVFLRMGRHRIPVTALHALTPIELRYRPN